MILDSIPDLELVSYLPEFLDGLLKYLSDPNPDVKIATENVLNDFLREIKHIARVQAQQGGAFTGGSVPTTSRPSAYPFQYGHARRISDMHGGSGSGGLPLRRRESKLTMNTDTSEMDSLYTGTGTAAGADGERTGDNVVGSPDLGPLDDLREEEDEHDSIRDKRLTQVSGSGDGDVGNTSMMTSQAADEEYLDDDLEEHEAWIPGQGVLVDYSAIMDLMIQHLSYPGKLDSKLLDQMTGRLKRPGLSR